MLDLELRDGDGVDLLSELNGWRDPPPIIVFTAQDTQQDLGPAVTSILIKSRTPLTGLVGEARKLLEGEAVA